MLTQWMKLVRQHGHSGNQFVIAIGERGDVFGPLILLSLIHDEDVIDRQVDDLIDAVGARHGRRSGTVAVATASPFGVLVPAPCAVAHESGNTRMAAKKAAIRRGSYQIISS